MIRKFVVILFLLLCSSNATAEIIDTGIFKVSIPDTMNVSWNQVDTILATNKKSEYSPPFLQIGYGSLEKDYPLYLQKVSQLKENLEVRTKVLTEQPNISVLSGHTSIVQKKGVLYKFVTIIKGSKQFVVVGYLTDTSEQLGQQFVDKIIVQIVESEL